VTRLLAASTRACVRCFEFTILLADDWLLDFKRRPKIRQYRDRLPDKL
jgi:hypothetical protein